ncbi:hypothetical protein ACTFIZ_000179 [Dictyostelium cf. discoideum]
MKVSLKDIKIPESWNKSPNQSYQYIEQIFEDSNKIGIYELNNQDHFSYVENSLKVISYFYPNFEKDQLKLCATYIHWLFLFDDFLEDENNTYKEKHNEVLKSHAQILLTGKYIKSDVEPKPSEKLTMLLQNTSKEWAIKNNKLDIHNICMTTLFQWMYSVNPLNKTTESEKPIHMDLYIFIRKVNIGISCSLIVALLVDRDITDVDISKIWLNPIFTRLIENSSIHIGLVNDCASYDKEFANGGHITNPLYFLQVRDNLTFNETFKLIVNKCSESIDEIINDEQLLLKELKEQGYTENQLNQINIILNYNHNLIQGNINWLLISKRYNNHDGKPFIFENRKSNFI